MRLTVARFVVAAIAVGPAIAQQSMPNQNLQNLSRIKNNRAQPPTRLASRTALPRQSELEQLPARRTQFGSPGWDAAD